MIYSVDLDKMAGRISFVDLCKYVTDLKWTKFTGKVRSGISIYQKYIGDQFYQITIPASRAFSDYDFSIRRVIQTLSETEGKSEEQLILELLNPMSDILRVRHISNEVENGSILFEDAINLYENAKKLLLDATLDVYNFKRIHKGRPPEEVQQFINKCRYGQTEIGSYVISLVCPFVSIDSSRQVQQLTLFSDEEVAAYSLTRKATSKVIQSINTIKQTIDNGEDLSELIENTEQKISVSFVEALTNLNLSTLDSSLEITAKWAPTIVHNKPEMNIAKISHDYYLPLKTIVDKYKAEDEKSSITIEGRISHLDANPKIEDRENGKAKMVYIDNKEQARKMQLELNREDYETAIKAHTDGLTIRAVGEMVNGRMKVKSLVIL